MLTVNNGESEVGERADVGSELQEVKVQSMLWFIHNASFSKSKILEKLVDILHCIQVNICKKISKCS